MPTTLPTAKQSASSPAHRDPARDPGPVRNPTGAPGNGRQVLIGDFSPQGCDDSLARRPVRDGQPLISAMYVGGICPPRRTGPRRNRSSSDTRTPGGTVDRESSTAR
ncbi:hypothetical protein [Streptomyces sp. NPDC059970]|uniref:hypothetical protein n=1 Tax=Streptomyces sp. NPDC059970 TaxID=3347019 RepID=UPI0036BFE606